MRQIPTSNRMYPICEEMKQNAVSISRNNHTAVYVPISVRTICPAVMLAASRKERVSGRESVLRVSTRTRNGVSQEGAPLGERLAVVCMMLNVMAERIIVSHNGKPKLAVNKMWLVRLNMYGVSPTKLATIRTMNRVEITVGSPRIWRMFVWAVCRVIKIARDSEAQVSCEGRIQ